MRGYPVFLLRGALTGLIMLLIITGCKSSGDFPLSRSEYEYVPPVMPRPTAVPTPVPTPQPAPAVSETDAQDEVVEESEAKEGLFSRWFSREPKPEAADVERVGDRDLPVVDENGVEGVQGPSENFYRMKAGDAVYITLTGSGGLSESIETLVDGEGSVKLRFIGSVKAEGLTTTELEREIELEYTERQKIYRNVTARVVVPNKFYFIGGEVRQPGKFPIVGRVTLSQAVVAAGNFTEWANEKRIILVRNNERVELDFRAISRDPLQDVELLPGDVVTVSRSAL